MWMENLNVHFEFVFSDFVSLLRPYTCTLNASQVSHKPVSPVTQLALTLYYPLDESTQGKLPVHLRSLHQ